MIPQMANFKFTTINNEYCLRNICPYGQTVNDQDRETKRDNNNVSVRDREGGKESQLSNRKS